MKTEEKENKIPLGQILYNIGYWIGLAQQYYIQVNEEMKKEHGDSTDTCD